MSARYRYATTISFGADGAPDYTELEVEFSYSVAWGSPGTGRPYYGPVELYDEGSPSEVEDLRLETVDGSARPFLAFTSDKDAEMLCIEALTEAHLDDMLSEAAEREAGRAEDAAERRHEDRRQAQ